MTKNYEYTELGNAKRFNDFTNGSYKWVREWKEWFRWNDTTSRWKEDDDYAVKREIEVILKSLEVEKAQLIKDKPDNLSKDDEKRFLYQLRVLNGWIKTSQSARGINAMLSLAKTQKGMTIAATEFDNKGHYLGIENGIIDLRSGELIVGNKEYLMTKNANISYDKDATCPNWNKFIGKIMEEDPDNVDFIQRLMGSCLVGRRSDKFFFLHGRSGQNGKSTLIDIVENILGDYAIVGDPKVFTEKSATKEYYLASWIGKRMVTFNESDKEEVKMAGTIIKQTTDSGVINGRHPMGRPFQYQPLFTPIYAVNHLPSASMDPALWRRLVIVPFNYRIPDDEKDENWTNKVLKEEGSGILNWLIEGAQQYYENGYMIPDTIINATNKEKIEMDTISTFIDDRYFRVDGQKVKINEVRKSFVDWCVDNGYRQNYTAQNFKREMEDRGFEVEKGTGNYQYVLGLSTSSVSSIQGRSDKTADHLAQLMNI